MRKAKGCRQTKSRSTPVPSSPCLRHAFHSTVQKQKSRTCLPCKVAFLSLGLARSKEKKKKREDEERIFEKSNYKSIKTGRSNSRAVHSSRTDFFFYLLPTWQLLKWKIVVKYITMLSYNKFLYLPQYIQELERLWKRAGGYLLLTETGKRQKRQFTNNLTAVQNIGC